jgi:predicted exporter
MIRWASVILWLAFMSACIGIISRSHFTADLSAFLPSAPTPEQKLLIDQIKSGVASRLTLVGIDGADPEIRARASKALASRLQNDSQFLYVTNGENVDAERDHAILFYNRYLLSPDITPARFTAEGLHDALQDSIEQLASTTGMFTKDLLPSDPTGEFMRILDNLGGDSQPNTTEGVWVSRDGTRSLLLVRTRAEGSDTDSQERAVRAIRADFEQARAELGSAAKGLSLVMTGPGVFSVVARATIKGEVTRLSALSLLVIATVLLAVYRSPLALLLGLLPVISGALAGVAAVSLWFGTVHGVTLGFGTALIGEAVDYSIYLLMQSERTGAAAGGRTRDWVAAFWPTIRIGVFTSVIGFASLLLSDFPGLAQLGLYAIAGLVVAAAVTRFVLPHLVPVSLQIRDMTGFGLRLRAWAHKARPLRWAALGLFIAACGIIYQERDSMWNQELSALSPVSAADQADDKAMRADLGAPDVRYLVVVIGKDMETALEGSEQVAARLRPLVEAGVIGGFQSPARFLPSVASQRARQTSLPSDAELRQRFDEAIVGLPVKTARFEPFFADVEAARSHALLQRQDIEGSSLAQGVDSLLVDDAGRWTALMPLKAPASGADIDAARLRAALAGLESGGDIHFIDMKGESDSLYAGYLREAILLSLAGLAAIVILLLGVTRSLSRVFRIVAPLALAVATVMAGLLLAGHSLTILHLVGMLLIFAVGSNYALFFDRGDGQGEIPPRTLASLAIATTTTVAGFGLLGFSSVPVLSAIGVTVGPGAVLALLFSAILARQPVLAEE